MPIVSSQITGQINKPEGRRKLLMQATDQVGVIRSHRPIVLGGNDDAATLAAWVVELDAALPDLEANAEVERAKRGDGVYSPDHQTEAEFDRKTLAGLMQIIDSLEFVSTLQWFRDFEVRGGPNRNARVNYLGVPTAEYVEVETRYNQITGLEAGLEADATRVWGEGNWQ